MRDHHVDRPDVDVRQRMQLTGPNRPSGSIAIPTPCMEIIPREIIPREIIPREIIPREIIPREIIPREIIPREIIPRMGQGSGISDYGSLISAH